ncbi:hypothetical protein BT69DRAFT_1343434 [Atractiella rhizophila]|nr:hypothetical protein BT69DRAFT_1343434 [Atractiella rhizophila]
MATVFPEFTLNDGRKIPSIAFGDRAAGEVLTAVDKFDFYHIDTAQERGLQLFIDEEQC